MSSGDESNTEDENNIGKHATNEKKRKRQFACLGNPAFSLAAYELGFRANWSSTESKKLIDEVVRFEIERKKFTSDNKKWTVISVRLQDNGVKRTADACSDRYRQIARKYKVRAHCLLVSSFAFDKTIPSLPSSSLSSKYPLPSHCCPFTYVDFALFVCALGNDG
jgi:hypothetical protein